MLSWQHRSQSPRIILLFFRYSLQVWSASGTDASCTATGNFQLFGKIYGPLCGAPLAVELEDPVRDSLSLFFFQIQGIFLKFPVFFPHSQRLLGLLHVAMERELQLYLSLCFAILLGFDVQMQSWKWQCANFQSHNLLATLPLLECPWSLLYLPRSF